MCINPRNVVVTDALTHRKTSYTVPCRRCAECKQLKKNKMSALLLLELMENTSDEMPYLVTFTFDNAHLPIVRTIYNIDENGEYNICSQKLIGNNRYDRYYRQKVTNDDTGYRHSRIYEPVTSTSHRVRYVNTYDIKDFQRTINAIRMYQHRKYNNDLVYLYAVEYGAQYHRPHFHVLFINVKKNSNFVENLQKHWKNGRVDIEPVTQFYKGNSNGYLRTCIYVQKYLYKTENDPFGSFSSKVRRSNFRFFNSQNFENICNYLKFRDHPIYRKSFENLTNFDENEKLQLFQEMDRRTALNLYGYQLPIPDEIIKKCFYRKQYVIDNEQVKTIFKPSEVYTAYLTYKRDCNDRLHFEKLENIRMEEFHTSRQNLYYRYTTNSEALHSSEVAERALRKRAEVHETFLQKING